MPAYENRFVPVCTGIFLLLIGGGIIEAVGLAMKGGAIPAIFLILLGLFMVISAFKD